MSRSKIAAFARTIAAAAGIALLGGTVSGATDLPAFPGAQGWARHVESLAARLLVPVKVEFKAK